MKLILCLLSGILFWTVVIGLILILFGAKSPYRII